MIVVYIILGIIGLVVLETVIHAIVLTLDKPLPDLPKDWVKYQMPETSKEHDAYVDVYAFLSGEEPELNLTNDFIYEVIKAQCDYVNARYDCSDFRLLLMFKIYKDCSEKLEERTRSLIEKTFLDFKYLFDEPGDDSMCYWSENHQLIFSVMEYLAGSTWSDRTFSNSGRTGAQHRDKGIEMVNAWMQQRFDFGFSEYLSSNYLAEDIAPMALFITYADDRTAVQRMKIVLDLLFFDVALNGVNGRLASTSTRMYANNKAGAFFGNSIQPALNAAWGCETKQKLTDETFSPDERKELETLLKRKPNHTNICFTDMLKKGIYDLPEAIREIALTDEPFESRMNVGLSPEDLEKEGLVGQTFPQLMAQFGAEAFTNPEVVENTIQCFKHNKLYKNNFIFYFKYLNLPIFRLVNIRRFAEKHELMTHGIALGRGDVYTYRTKHYSLSTSMKKSIDKCGTQEHIWSADLAPGLTLFTTHPAAGDDKRFGSSPGYWIGNGRLPMSVQHKNVNITIYRLPDKKRFPEQTLSRLTHAYFPKCFYDEVVEHENVIFARKGSVLVALIMNGKYTFKPFCAASADPFYKTLRDEKVEDSYQLTGEFDLCRYEKDYHIYITELSDLSIESFGDFRERILSNRTDFDTACVTYESNGVCLFADYDGDFSVNGAQVPNSKNRYDSRFCVAARKAKEIRITAPSGKTHTVSLDKAKRE
ncbi:MAG: hypothetical protein GX051_01955 [Clostridiales bacterium]|nr:hypothetical protein [Clostridiales bacterium]